MTHEAEIKKLFLAMEDVVIGHCSKTQEMAGAFAAEKGTMQDVHRDTREQQIQGRLALLDKYVAVKTYDKEITLTLDLIGQPLALAVGNEPQELVGELAKALTGAGIKDVRVTSQHQNYADHGDPEKRRIVHIQNPNKGTPDEVSNFPILRVTLPDTEESVGRLRNALKTLVCNRANSTVTAGLVEAKKLTSRLDQFNIPR